MQNILSFSSDASPPLRRPQNPFGHFGWLFGFGPRVLGNGLGSLGWSLGWFRVQEAQGLVREGYGFRLLAIMPDILWPWLNTLHHPTKQPESSKAKRDNPWPEPSTFKFTHNCRIPARSVSPTPAYRSCSTLDLRTYDIPQELDLPQSHDVPRQ